MSRLERCQSTVRMMCLELISSFSDWIWYGLLLIQFRHNLALSHTLSVNIRWSQIWRKTNRLWRVIIRSWPVRWRVCSKPSLNLSTRERNLRLSCRSSWPASARERRLKESFQTVLTNYRSVLSDCHINYKWVLLHFISELFLLHLVRWNTVTLPPPSHTTDDDCCFIGFCIKLQSLN